MLHPRDLSLCPEMFTRKFQVKHVTVLGLAEKRDRGKNKNLQGNLERDISLYVWRRISMYVNVIHQAVSKEKKGTILGS